MERRHIAIYGILALLTALVLGGLIAVTALGTDELIAARVTSVMDAARAAMGPIVDAFIMDQKIMSTKAGRMLGWAPRWPTVLDEIRSGSYAPPRPDAG